MARVRSLPMVQPASDPAVTLPDFNDLGFGEVFFKRADPLITRNLKERGLLLRDGRVRHSYPFCWRCDAPEGFFRPFGASTPVFCEACYRMAREHQDRTGYFPPDSQAALRARPSEPDRSDLDYEDQCARACGL